MTNISHNSALLKPYADSVSKRIIARTGKIIPQFISDFTEINAKGSMNRFTFMTLAALLLLGGRYYQARNDDEKREVFTRDFSAIATAVYAVPILKKFAGKLISNGGIPIVYDQKVFEDNSASEKSENTDLFARFKHSIDLEKGTQLASYDQLKQWHSVDDASHFKNIKEGFTGFCKNIAETLNGNLSKGFAVLDPVNAHNTLLTLAAKFGIKANKENLDNNTILEIIKKAETASGKAKKEAEPHLNKLMKLFEVKKEPKKESVLNQLLEKASHRKSLTEFSSIISTAFLLGGFLPWFNIWYTRRLYKNKNNENVAYNPDSAKNHVVASKNNIIINNSANIKPQNKAATGNNVSMAEKFNNFQKIVQ